jgi:hypothetical protein
MTNNSNTAKNTNISDKYGYYLDDNDCIICSYYRGKKGCSRAVCCLENEHADAIAKGRLKRKKGWTRQWDKE